MSVRTLVKTIQDIITERQHFGDIYQQILNDLQSAGNAGEFYTPRALTSFMVQMTDPKSGETLFNLACGPAGVRPWCCPTARCSARASRPGSRNT
jgi:type I restriction enzyme M protein